MVKRFKVSNGLLIIRTTEAHNTFNLKNTEVVLASDYDDLSNLLKDVHEWGVKYFGGDVRWKSSVIGEKVTASQADGDSNAG